MLRENILASHIKKNKNPTMKALAKIAGALGASLDDLVKGENTKS
jgi:hypothetical protein